ncbi:MAG TPA: mandelate racemase/muconate lactonizing enzyme family protein [Xanthobacteraceae bacterium]|jgi:L-alanine-DL-glutamate epimerase-like enolase superfamily enzyme|nr:mandelate racemase/muconate lactonizing enzyme family protein [Xanthobacteraceae bacterium]
MTVRLAEYRLYTYRLRYTRPVRWSDIVEDAAPFVLLRLTADNGAEGVAEITVKPTWCGVTARSLIAAVEDIFVPLLKKCDLSSPEKVREALDAVPENHAAKTLIDNACWDLYAAHKGRPLWQIWNGRPQIELSWAVTRQAPQAMAAEAADMVARYGFRALKIKGGQGFDTDVAGIRAIRAAVGDNIRFYVDANGAYPVDKAADYARAIADAGVILLEDPCPFTPDARFRKLQEDSALPILVDFGCTSLRDAHLFQEQGARALSIKPGRFGLSHSHAMLKLMQQNGGNAVVGLMGESALGTLAGLQFAAAVDKPLLPAELTWFLAMKEQIISEVPEISNGVLTLTEKPSLAALIDWQALTAL